MRWVDEMEVKTKVLRWLYIRASSPAELQMFGIRPTLATIVSGPKLRLISVSTFST